jgi:hypothetical protein
MNKLKLYFFSPFPIATPTIIVEPNLLSGNRESVVCNDFGKTPTV